MTEGIHKDKPKSRLTAAVKISLTPETHARLLARARVAGCSKAELIRRFVRDGVERYRRGDRERV